MILNCETLSSMIGSFVFIFGFRMVFQGFFEKYSQYYIITYLLKNFDKQAFIAHDRDTQRLNNILSINETSDKSLNYVLSFLYPIMSFATYLYYENMSYQMIKTHYFYFFILMVFFMILEPFTSFFINAIRLTRDANYLSPKIYKKLEYNYNRRSVS